VLQVYVAGDGPNSRLAVENLKKICEQELPGQYRIDVVDVTHDPQVAIENNLIALPAIVRTLPPPLRRFIGNCAKEDKTLRGLGLIERDKPEDAEKLLAQGMTKHALNLPKAKLASWMVVANVILNLDETITKE